MNEKLIEELEEVRSRCVSIDARLALATAIAALLESVTPCCGEYATCLRACTPRGKWLQSQEPAKFEPIYQCGPTPNVTYARAPKATLSGPAKPKPLPEVEEWIDSRLFAAGRDAVVTTDEIREYIAKLTAAHKAAMAEKDAEIERLAKENGSLCKALRGAEDGEARPIAWANKSTAYDLKHKGADNIIACLTTTICTANTEPLYSRAELIRLTTNAEAKGRRDALMAVPVEALANIMPVLAYSTHPMAHGSYRALSDFLAKVHAAQAEHNNGDKQ